MPAGIQALRSDVAFKWLLLSPALDCSTSCWQTDQNSVPRFPLLSAATPKQSQLFIYNLLWKSPSSLLWWIIELFDLDRVQRAASLALRPEVEEAGEAWAERESFHSRIAEISKLSSFPLQLSLTLGATSPPFSLHSRMLLSQRKRNDLLLPHGIKHK